MSGFLELSAVKTVGLAIEKAMSNDRAVRVVGSPGMGKTEALLHFHRKHRAHYCTVTAAYKDTAGMYHMLYKAFDIKAYGKTKFEHSEDLRSSLRTTGWVDNEWSALRHDRPLLVDEYQTFEHTALRELLEIAKDCRIPLVLCGNSERLAKESKRDALALEQIWRRIKPTYYIDPPDPDDCRSIAIEFNVECDKDTYAACAAYGGRTSVDALCWLLKEARNVVPDGPIRLPAIKVALIANSPSRDALKLLSPATPA